MNAIKYYSAIVLLALCSFPMLGQSPPLLSGTCNTNSGINHIYYDDDYSAPNPSNLSVEYTQECKTMCTSSGVITLGDGFSADGFTNDGFFHVASFDHSLGVYDNSSGIAFITPAAYPYEVCRYNKLEIQVALVPPIDASISNFLTSNYNDQYTNPYDPDEISVEATFTPVDASGNQNGTSVLRYGFFYCDMDYTGSTSQDAYHNAVYSGQLLNTSTSNFPDLNEDWTGAEPASGLTHCSFRVRYAPETTGFYRITVRLLWKNESGVYIEMLPNSSVVGFECIDNNCNNPGFLQFNGNYLQFSGSGDPFFAVGNNIECPHSYYNTTGALDIHPPRQYYMKWDINLNGVIEPFINWVDGAHSEHEFHNYIYRLSEAGGNFFRTILTPWSTEIEWENLGNYHSRQGPASEMDAVFNFAEQYNSIKGHNNLYVFFVATLHSAFTHPAYEYPGMPAWDSNPYSTINTMEFRPDYFFTNPEAIYKYKNKLRYINARWGYSTSFAALEPLDEFCRVGYGYTDANGDTIKPGAYNGNSVYVNNLTTWISTIKDYLLNELNWNVPVTTEGGTNIDFGNISIDFTSTHVYNRNMTIDHQRFRISNENLVYSKPTIFGEMGPGASVREISVDDSYLHNSLWATAMSGNFGTGLDFDWCHNHMHWSSTFPKIREFFSGLDLNNGLIPYHFPNYDYIPATNATLGNYPFCNSLYEAVSYYDYLTDADYELYALVGEDNIYGWIHNRSYYYGNIIPKEEPCVSGSGFFGGIPYLWENDAGGYSTDDDEFTNLVDIPDIVPLTGFIIHDSRFVLDDVYNVDWYRTRNDPASTITSSTAIVFLNNLLLVFMPDIDGLKNLDNDIYQNDNDMQDPDYAFKITKIIGHKSSHISDEERTGCLLYPNPTDGSFIIELTGNATGAHVEICDLPGKTLFSTEFSGTKGHIDISGWPKGVYIVKTTTGNQSFVEKVVYK